MQARYSWLWDTDLENEEFDALLSGRRQVDGRDAHWAMLRLIEYAPFREIKRLLPRETFLNTWPGLSRRVRSETRRDGMTFFHQWLKEHGQPDAWKLAIIGRANEFSAPHPIPPIIPIPPSSESVRV